jgi:alpha-glucoside transport system substrate-binding protein
MKGKLFSLFTWLIMASMLLVACGGGGQQASPTAGEVTSPTTAVSAPTTGAEASPTTAAAPTEAATAAATSAAQPTAAATSGTASGQIDCSGAKQGDTITILYQWSGQEETRFSQIMKPLVDACGITLKPESTRDQGLLDTRVKAGTPPDIAFWNIAQLVQYQGQLQAMDALGADKSNYNASLLSYGTINGKWVGLPVKTDIKTIIWYSPTVFQAKNYTVPKTWDDLNTLVEKMVADGNVPWSMGFESGGATGWTGADFIQDILLVQKGPQYVSDLASGKVPYNDAGVKTAFETYGKWAKDPKYALGGAQGTLSTNFNDAIDKVFSDPPGALMVRQSGFAAGEITTKYPDLKYGTDYDFFLVPGAQGMQVGADWMMAFKNSPAVQAMVKYLTSTTGGANWAKAGFDLSPNKGGTGNYSDPSAQKKAQLLADAPSVVISNGDVIPGGFGTALWTGIVNYVNGQDLDTQLNNIAKAQSDALKK